MKNVFLATLVALAAASAFADRVERREALTIPAAGFERIAITHGVGTLVIEGDDVADVGVELEVVCGSFRFNCDEKAKWIELSHRGHGDTLRIEVEGYPNNSGGLSVDLVLRVPRRVAVDIERGVGDTTIRGIEGDVQVEAGVGDVDLEMREGGVRSLRIETGVGGADLRVGGRREGREGGFLFLGNEIDWHGDGASRVDVEVGVGSVKVARD